MALTRHRAIDHVKTTTASQGTKQDAKPCGHEVLTAAQEWDELQAEKRAVEAELSRSYGQTAFLKEQRRVRRENGGISRWIDKKAEMEEARTKLVVEKLRIETRMGNIKQAAHAERRAAFLATQIPYDKLAIWQEMLSELRAIRLLLEKAQSQQPSDTPAGRDHP